MRPRPMLASEGGAARSNDDRGASYTRALSRPGPAARFTHASSRRTMEHATRAVSPLAMSLRAFAWAWELPDLTPAQRLVLLCLADHADQAGLCWPALARIVSRTGLSRSAVTAAIRQLAVAGVVLRESGTGRTSTRYRLAVAADVRVPPDGTLSERPVRSVAAGVRHAAPRVLPDGTEPVIEPSGTTAVTAVGADNDEGKSNGRPRRPTPRNRAWAWEQTRKCLAAGGRGTLDLHPHVQAVIRAAGGMARLAADTEVAARVAFYAAWRQLDGTEETA